MDKKKVKLAYLSGPVDAADVHTRWSAGKHTQLFGTSYLMQFYELCARLDADALVVTTLPGAFTRQVVDNVIVENRPPPKSTGWRYHLAIVGGMLALAPSLLKFRPSAFVITAHQNYWFALAYVKLLGIQIIPSAHCVLWRPYGSNPVHWRFLLWLDGLFLRFCVLRAMAISSVVADQLRALAKTPRLQVAVVTPTYAEGHFDQVGKPRHGDRPFRVLFNGRIEANKGVFDLVAMAAQLHAKRPNEFVFDVCGNGTELERLHAEVLARGLQDVVKVHGFCNKDRMGELIAASHVVIVPTRSDFEEGLAKSCVEAVLAGRPFVTSRVCPAVLTLAHAGVEVAPDDVAGYLDALVRLADDPAFYMSKAEACGPLQPQFYDTDLGYGETLMRQLAGLGLIAPTRGAVRVTTSSTLPTALGGTWATMFTRLYRRAVIAIARPYIRREWPGWGLVYRTLVGSFERDWLWEGETERWVCGKIHGLELSVRIGGWSNRFTYFLERFYDLPTQLLMAQVLREGDTFVDVGANEGMMTLLASHLVGPQGCVISFEPNPVPRSILERNLVRNGISNVEVHACGLGDESGELSLFVPRVNTGEGSFTQPADASTGETICCPVRVGDQMIGSRRPVLIKVDVEGFETHVLKGLTGTLLSARPMIVLELIAGHLLRDGQTPQQLCDWLTSLGYEGKRLALRGRHELELLPMTGDWQDGDYVFVHRECSR